MENKVGPLNGIHVLDLTRVLSGASCEYFVIGEHNHEVYKELLGLNKEDVDKMLEGKTI